MPIHCVPDHVAAAVPRIADAHDRWRGRLGAGDFANGGPFLGFRNHQYTFRGGGKLELLEAEGGPEPSFVDRFIERFGASVHHVTLKVSDLPEALEVLAAADLQVVDVSLDDERWREAFVRPSVVGGLIVQVASSSMSDDEWYEVTGFTPTPPAEDGAVLLGPLLAHPDLDRARHVWHTLGGSVTEADTDVLEVRWGDAPLTVQVRRGEVAGPVGLRFADAPPLPADPTLGPAVLPG